MKIIGETTVNQKQKEQRVVEYKARLFLMPRTTKYCSWSPPKQFYGEWHVLLFPFDRARNPNSKLYISSFTYVMIRQ